MLLVLDVCRFSVLSCRAALFAGMPGFVSDIRMCLVTDTVVHSFFPQFTQLEIEPTKEAGSIMPPTYHTHIHVLDQR